MWRFTVVSCKTKTHTPRQGGAPLFNWTLFSIRPDWKRWLILSTCCHNGERARRPLNFIGTRWGFEKSWGSTKPSEADSGGVGGTRCRAPKSLFLSTSWPDLDIKVKYGFNKGLRRDAEPHPEFGWSLIVKLMMYIIYKLWLLLLIM